MRFAVAVLAGCLLSATVQVQSMGAVVIVAQESNGNVTFTGSGTLNLDDLPAYRDVLLYSALVPVHDGYHPVISIGGSTIAAIPAAAYGGPFDGPSSFGAGPVSFPHIVSGDRFGTGNNNSAREVYVPVGYKSGEMLSGSSTYVSQTFLSLGIIPGTYVWSWGVGDDADSLTLKIVPEPSAAVMIISASALLIVRSGRSTRRDLLPTRLGGG
jgi:hypothetical protein